MGAADDIGAFAGVISARGSAQRGNDAAPQLETPLFQQRSDELQQRCDGGLSDGHKQELRELLQAQHR